MSQTTEAESLVPLAAVPGINTLARGLATGEPDVAEFLPDRPTLDAVTGRAREALAAFTPRDPEHADPALQAFTSGRAAAVVAGQQVGLFTGPTLTLIKAAAAHRLGADVAARGVPAQGLFWCATEDHDLVEVTRVGVPGVEGPRELGPPPEPLAGNRRPVGALPIDVDVLAMLDAAAAQLGQPPEPEVWEALRRLTPGSTYHRAFVETLRFTLGFPMPVADAARLADKRDLLPLASRVVLERDEVRRLLAERAGRLETAGHPLQVTTDPRALPLFAIVEGERFALHAVGDRLSLKGRAREDETFSPEEVVERFASGAWLPSFSALTRPLAASVLYPVAASILGPAEIAYWAQAFPLFRWAGIVPPVLVPRPMAAFLEPSARRLLEKLELTLPELLEGSEAILKARGGRRAAGLMSELSSQRAGALERLEALSPRLLEIDPALTKALETTRGNVRFAFEKLEERVAAASGRNEEAFARQLQRLVTALAPGRRMAERAYTPLPLLLRYGRAAIAEPLLSRLRWDLPGVQLFEVGS